MTATDLDAARAHQRAELLDLLDEHRAAGNVAPCQATDPHAAAAWTAEDDDEQRVAAAACRSLPCPAIEACRLYGITNPREVGAYGGLTETERRRTARNIERRTA